MPNKQIAYNRKVHDQIVDEYEERHGEIFNPLEQERLHQAIKDAMASLQTEAKVKQALDYGCGSGNITRHLIGFGLHITAADVSTAFLEKVKERYGDSGAVTTVSVNGEDLSSIENDQFDFVALYSVLHHIPDYIGILQELVRVLKPGGVLFIDHEHTPAYWKEDPVYREFIFSAVPPRQRTWKRFFVWSNYVFHLRRLSNPHYEPEGDIHVFPDDHIEWDAVEQQLVGLGCMILWKEDYLVYKKEYALDVYRAYQTRCSDMRLLVARKTRG